MEDAREGGQHQKDKTLKKKQVGSALLQNLAQGAEMMESKRPVRPQRQRRNANASTPPNSVVRP